MAFGGPQSLIPGLARPVFTEHLKLDMCLDSLFESTSDAPLRVSPYQCLTGKLFLRFRFPISDI